MEYIFIYLFLRGTGKQLDLFYLKVLPRFSSVPVEMAVIPLFLWTKNKLGFFAVKNRGLAKSMDFKTVLIIYLGREYEKNSARLAGRCSSLLEKGCWGCSARTVLVFPSDFVPDSFMGASISNLFFNSVFFGKQAYCWKTVTSYVHMPDILKDECNTLHAQNKQAAFSHRAIFMGLSDEIANVFSTISPPAWLCNSLVLYLESSCPQSSTPDCPSARDAGHQEG